MHTAVYNGMFMDFYGSPLLKSNVGSFPMFVDIANNVAVKPGSGDQAVVLTRVLDIARFVVRILDLAVWPKESYIIGDRVTLHDFVNMAEEARGMCMFLYEVSTVTYLMGLFQVPSFKSPMTPRKS